jgi:hypothetical protein
MATVRSRSDAPPNLSPGSRDTAVLRERKAENEVSVRNFAPGFSRPDTSRTSWPEHGRPVFREQGPRLFDSCGTDDRHASFRGCVSAGFRRIQRGRLCSAIDILTRSPMSNVSPKLKLSWMRMNPPTRRRGRMPLPFRCRRCRVSSSAVGSKAFPGSQRFVRDYL